MLMKHCNKYRARYIENMPPYIVEFECTECQDGFVKTPENFYDKWDSYTAKHVCMPKKTETDQDCDEACQAMFPNCANIKVGTNVDNYATYTCNKCVEGYHRINYEDEAPGQITQSFNHMSRTDPIVLCTDTEGEVYLDLVNCSVFNPTKFDNEACIKTVNCDLVANVKHVPSGEHYYKCLVCPNGTSLKPHGFRPKLYDIDQTRCQEDE